MPRRPSPSGTTASARTATGRSAKSSTKTAEQASTPIRCDATLLRPATEDGAKPVAWSFLVLPTAASKQLPSRGMVSVEGTFGSVPFAATLNPDGKGGHWLKVEPALRKAAGVDVGGVVALRFAPVTEEPEPTVPAELRAALAAAPVKAREVWADITSAARRDFVQWIETAKLAETRVKRVATACDMLAKGKRRPCCFDRSGIYGKNLSCPVAEEAAPTPRRSKS